MVQTLFDPKLTASSVAVVISSVTAYSQPDYGKNYCC